MAKKETKQRPVWLGILITLICLFVIGWLIDPQQIWAELQTADYRYLLLANFLTLLFLTLRIFRWRLLLRYQINWVPLFHIQNIGYMLNMLLPFRAGDLAKVVLVGGQSQLSMAQGLSTMVVERVLDLLFFVILLPFAMAGIDQFPPEMRQIGWVSGTAALLGLTVLITAANQRGRVQTIAQAVLDRLPLNKETWLKQINQLLDGLEAFTRWQDGVQLLFWSVILWIPVLLGYHVVMLAVGLQLSPLMVAFTTCAAAFSVAAPSSPGQFGVFHAGVTFALVTILGQPAAPAASFAFLYHTNYFLFMIFVGLVGLFGAGTTFGQLLSLVRRNAQ